MSYDASLAMLRQAFHKCLIPTRLLDPETLERDQMVPPWQQMSDPRPDIALLERLGQVEPRIIYSLVDGFSCHYFYMLLPEDFSERLLLVGPFMVERLTHRRIVELAENYKVSARQLKQLETFLNTLPQMPEPEPLYALLDAFAEQLWGSDYTDVEVGWPEKTLFSLPLSAEEGGESTMETLRMMEGRYAYENDLIRAVANGQTHKADILLANLKDFPFEQRLGDRIRSMKNYSIILNTLLRKAVEQGGVHPLYIDRVSSSFARQIEAVVLTEDFTALWREMVHKYCALVRDHTIKKHSRLVQQVIIGVDFDLTTDLSLQATADRLNVNASYLSTLFKKEMGRTITEYVAQKRMEHAAYLLVNTAIPIAVVAQSCGIHDDNYFTKLFKKYAGIPPKQFRQEHSHLPGT